MSIVSAKAETTDGLNFMLKHFIIVISTLSNLSNLYKFRTNDV